MSLTGTIDTPLRVAMLGSYPADPDRVPGGVEAVIVNLSTAMARLAGLDVHVVTCVQNLAEAHTGVVDGVTVHWFPGQTRLGHLTDHFLEQRRLRRCVTALAPDIVHAHGTGHFVEAALATGLPCVATPHGIRFREVGLFKGPRAWLRAVTTIRQEKRVLARAEDLFVIADYVGRAIRPLTRATFHPVANAVAPRFFELTTREDENLVVCVAAVQPRKGLLDLVEAMARVRRKVPTARLMIVGKILFPAYARRLSERIAALGLEDAVDMTGFVPGSVLDDALARCAVFTLCSVEESSPVAIAEAMTLGKPVVATAVGGVPDLVAEGRTGHLVTYGDVPNIADKLSGLLREPQRRRAYGTAARERAERDFHPARAAELTVAAYREILRRKGDGS